MILVLLPAYLLLNACGSKAPDPSSLQKSSASSAAGKSADQITSTTNPSTASTTEPVSIADLKAKQNALETEKSNLIAKQGNVQSQKQSFASPAAMTPEARDLEAASHLDLLEDFDLVTDLDVVVALDANTALHAGTNFRCVILKATQ